MPPSRAPTNSAIAALPGGVTVRLTANSGKQLAVGRPTGSDRVCSPASSRPAPAKVFTDPASVKLVLGNAGAVSLNVNGAEIGSPGKTGEVVRLSFGPGDPLGRRLSPAPRGSGSTPRTT